MIAKNRYLISFKNQPIENLNEIIVTLYGPIIGFNAANLYLLLANEYGKIYSTIERLCILTGQSIDQIEEDIKKLENYSLLKTYFHSTNQEYLFELRSPLDGQAFFSHQVLSRTYLNAVGSQQFEISKGHFICNNIDLKEYEDITHPIDLNQLAQWDENDEQQYQKVSKMSVNNTFDYDTFLSNNSQLMFPSVLRTKENLETIGKLATQFAVPAKKMIKLVAKSVDLINQKLDLEALRIKCINEKQVDVVDLGYKSNPVSFLYGKQGVGVSTADKKLIEYLQNDLHFNNEVTNVLIEYTLNNTNNSLSKDYVEKVATSWVRNKIDTFDKAIAATSGKIKKKNIYDGQEMKAAEVDVESLRKALFEHE